MSVVARSCRRNPLLAGEETQLELARRVQHCHPPSAAALPSYPGYRSFATRQTGEMRSPVVEGPRPSMKKSRASVIARGTKRTGPSRGLPRRVELLLQRPFQVGFGFDDRPPRFVQVEDGVSEGVDVRGTLVPPRGAVTKVRSAKGMDYEEIKTLLAWQCQKCQKGIRGLLALLAPRRLAHSDKYTPSCWSARTSVLGLYRFSSATTK